MACKRPSFLNLVVSNRQAERATSTTPDWTSDPVWDTNGLDLVTLPPYSEPARATPDWPSPTEVVVNGNLLAGAQKLPTEIRVYYSKPNRSSGSGFAGRVACKRQRPLNLLISNRTYKKAVLTDADWTSDPNWESNGLDQVTLPTYSVPARANSPDWPSPTEAVINHPLPGTQNLLEDVRLCKTNTK